MTCESIEAELTAYHFGLVSSETRAEVETHLMTCSACLRAFLDVKRAVEMGEEGPPPSANARARLRRAVAQELRIDEPERRFAWWERPVAFTFAAAAVMAAMLATRGLTSWPAAPPYAISSGSVELTGGR